MDFSNFLDKVKLLAYDCDGVLTDNRVSVDENGRESAWFNRGDGTGIARIKAEVGIPQIIISTETNPIVVKRGQKLGLEVISGVDDKGSVLREYCKDNHIPLTNVMFIGNDINDLAAMKIVGFRGCPSDAEEEILCIADWISDRKGGEGVIRDLYRQISKSIHG